MSFVVKGYANGSSVRFKRSAHYIKQDKVTVSNELILISKTDIAISTKLVFRFYFVPTKKGELKAEFSYTSVRMGADNVVNASRNCRFCQTQIFILNLCLLTLFPSSAWEYVEEQLCCA